MKEYLTPSRRLFLIINTTLIVFIGLICIFPVWNLLAKSFSGSQAILENRVLLIPVDFTTSAYEFVIKNKEFWTAVSVTMKRVLIGVPLNMILTVLAAYPLSKSDTRFKARKYYSIFFIFLMIFNGGLIPTYVVINKLGMIDTIWSLVLPGAVPIFNVILMMNFFRGVPESLEESAMLDGASQWTILTKVYLPLAKPSLATVTLFSLVGHWNSWFDGLIYSNFTQNYPLQSYLQTMIVDIQAVIRRGDLQAINDMLGISNTNMKAAQIFISIVPLLIVYPFAQKHFTAGLTVGSVKG